MFSVCSNSCIDSGKYESIGAHPERISKIISFIHQYNWEDISQQDHVIGKCLK